MTWKKTALVLIPAIALTLGAYGGAEAGPNLVLNGSFEADAPSTKVSFFGNVSGWSGGANLTFLDPPGTADDGSYLSVYPGFPKNSPDGGNFIEADGDPNFSDAFSQTINGLTLGQTYTLSFFQAAGQQVGFTGPTTERWSVTFGSDTQLSNIFSLPQAATGSWQSQTMSFTATNTSQVLSFLAVGTPNGAPPISFLDGVSVIATPEPGNLILSATCLLGVGAFRLVRRRKIVAV